MDVPASSATLSRMRSHESRSVAFIVASVVASSAWLGRVPCDSKPRPAAKDDAPEGGTPCMVFPTATGPGCDVPPASRTRRAQDSREVWCTEGVVGSNASSKIWAEDFSSFHFRVESESDDFRD